MANANVPLSSAKNTSNIIWSDKPLLPLRTAADLLGISRSGLYRLQASGKLTFCKLGGRTVVKTTSLISYLDTIEEMPAAGAPDRSTKAV
jgi:excisionase family DNA binding protein